LEAWIKPDDASTGADQDIISKWAGIATASCILQVDATGKSRLVIANGANVRVILSNGTLGDRTWHHVAATFNNGTAKLYVNGALDRTVTGVPMPLVSTEPVAFVGTGALLEAHSWGDRRDPDLECGALRIADRSFPDEATPGDRGGLGGLLATR
jgi:hypothetical protein